jgi:hypothetical protein
MEIDNEQPKGTNNLYTSARKKVLREVKTRRTLFNEKSEAPREREKRKREREMRGSCEILRNPLSRLNSHPVHTITQLTGWLQSFA